MDMAEVKQLLDGFGRTIQEYKSTNDEMVRTKDLGKAIDPLIKEKMAKLDTAITQFEDVKKEIDKIHVALNRKGTVDKDGNELPADHMEAKKAYNSFLRKGIVDKQDQKQFSWDQKSMSVQSDPDGGYTVTADMAGRVVERIFETSPIRSVASVQQISSDALEGGYDGDEAGAEWVSEQGTRNPTGTPQLGKWRIEAHELSAAPIATQKLLDDSMVNIEAWLAKRVADKFARTENDAFVNGNGVGKPRGFLTYAAADPSAAGLQTRGTIQQIASASSGAITAAQLFNLAYALKAAYRVRAQFAMPRLALSQVRQLKDSQNRYLWEPSLQVGEPTRLLGFGIQEFNDMPTPAADSLSIAIADWAEAYQIVDRTGLRVLRDPYTNKPYVIFYTTKRVGGAVINFEAIKIGKLT